MDETKIIRTVSQETATSSVESVFSVEDEQYHSSQATANPSSMLNSPNLHYIPIYSTAKSLNNFTIDNFTKDNFTADNFTKDNFTNDKLTKDNFTTDNFTTKQPIKSAADNVTGTLQLEPLLSEQNKRLSIFPIRHNDIWEFYKSHEEAIWHVHEVKLDRDTADWEKLSDDERYFIKHVLAFFASSDLIVAENLSQRFMREVKIPEVQFFYGFQIMMENIHSEMYSVLIEKYIKNAKEKSQLFNAVETMPCIMQKAKWAQRWIESSNVFAERLIAFAIVEGVFFSGAFCSIFWLKERGLMPGLSLSNNFISRDEGLHCDFACHLYVNYITNKVTGKRLREIMTEAVDLEIDFITQALPCRLLGINADLMTNYIKYVANRLSQQLGYDEIYTRNNTPIENPFPFMNRIGLKGKSNFFEEPPSEYSKTSTIEEDAYDDL